MPQLQGFVEAYDNLCFPMLKLQPTKNSRPQTFILVKRGVKATRFQDSQCL